MHSPFASIQTSSIFPMVAPNSDIVSLSIHIMGTFFSCTQNDAYVKDNFDTSPIPLGSVKIISAPLKCHGPLAIALLSSAFVANLNMNVFSPMVSTFTSLIVCHACYIANFSPFLFTFLFVNTLPTRHPATIFSSFDFIVLLKNTFPSSPPFKVIALHFCINSYVSILNTKESLLENHTNLYLKSSPTRYLMLGSFITTSLTGKKEILVR